MQIISGVGCMQARSGSQSSHLPSPPPSPSLEDLEAQPTSTVVDPPSPPLIDLEAQPTSTVVDPPSPPLIDLEAQPTSSVADQKIPINVGAAPVLGQNQAGQVRNQFDLGFHALVGQMYYPSRAW